MSSNTQDVFYLDHKSVADDCSLVECYALSIGKVSKDRRASIFSVKESKKNEALGTA